MKKTVLLVTLLALPLTAVISSNANAAAAATAEAVRVAEKAAEKLAGLAVESRTAGELAEAIVGKSLKGMSRAEMTNAIDAALAKNVALKAAVESRLAYLTSSATPAAIDNLLAFNNKQGQITFVTAAAASENRAGISRKMSKTTEAEANPFADRLEEIRLAMKAKVEAGGANEALFKQAYMATLFLQNKARTPVFGSQAPKCIMEFNPAAVDNMANIVIQTRKNIEGGMNNLIVAADSAYSTVMSASPEASKVAMEKLGTECQIFDFKQVAIK